MNGVVERKEDSRTRLGGGGCPVAGVRWQGARRPGETRQEWNLRLLNSDFLDSDEGYCLNAVYTGEESTDSRAELSRL